MSTQASLSGELLGALGRGQTLREQIRDDQLLRRQVHRPLSESRIENLRPDLCPCQRFIEERLASGLPVSQVVVIIAAGRLPPVAVMTGGCFFFLRPSG